MGALVLFLACAAVCVHAREALDTEEKVTAYLWKHCLEGCDNVLKDADCKLFCSFVDHIAREHGAEMVQYVKKFPRASATDQAMEWAMEETVRWKKQTYQDNEHYLEVHFKERFEFYYETLTREL